MNYQVTWEPCSANLAEQLNPFIRGANFNGVTSITYRHAKMYGGPYVDNVNTVTEISGPNLTEIVSSAEDSTGTYRFFGTLEIFQCDLLETISFPLLTTVGNLYIQDNYALTSVDFSSLVNVTRTEPIGSSQTALTISRCEPITSISLPAFEEIVADFQEVNVYQNTYLTSFSFPNFVPANGSGLYFYDNALNQTSVDHILARCVANAGFVSGTVDISGGTNATPSVSGLADKATLIGRGVTVFTN